MAFTPRFGLLLKVLLRRRDPAAAEGLFLEGSAEYEAGDLESARLAFAYGTRLDPGLAGNFHNLAVVLEKQRGPGKEALRAWRAYLAAADRDPRQPEDAKARARERVREIESMGF